MSILNVTAGQEYEYQLPHHKITSDIKALYAGVAIMSEASELIKNSEQIGSIYLNAIASKSGDPQKIVIAEKAIHQKISNVNYRVEVYRNALLKIADFDTHLSANAAATAAPGLAACVALEEFLRQEALIGASMK